MQRLCGPRRSGFSAVELLVSLAILALLVALLLPAIQRVRHGADRIKSSNQLRQLGLAYGNYVASETNRPTSRSDAVEYGGGGLFTRMLPYLEQVALAESSTIVQSDGSTRYIHRVGNFLNPLDPSLQTSNDGNPTVPPGDCSYAVNSLICRAPVVDLQIPDGASNTIAFAERYANCNSVRVSASDLGNSTCYNLSGQKIPCTLAMLSHRRATFADEKYADDFRPINAGATPGPLAAPPDEWTFQKRPSIRECDPRGIQSGSPGGVGVALADGSVRTISHAMTPRVFWELISPTSGNVTD